MSLTNRLALLEYDVGGPVVVHERMVLDHIEAEDYVVCTPDRDIYVETLSVLNPDLRAFRVRPRANMLPAGVAAGSVYPLPAWTVDEIADIRAEASREADNERRRRNVGAVAPVPVHPVVGGGGVVPQAPAEDVNPGACDIRGEDGVWVFAETLDGCRYGDKVQGVAIPPVVGEKIVHTLPNGRKVFCICINEKGVEEFNNRPALCDGRILPRKNNSLGVPEMTLADAAAKSKQFDLGWKVVGPRTAKWCLAYLSVEGLGLEGHHERFRQLCRLETSSWGVMEHFQLSMFVKHLIQTDMVNPCNSQGLELMFRRLQTIEYSHSEKAREAEAKATGGKLSLEEQASFGSIVRQSGTLMISPDLLTHVKEEVERDAALQKNLRKAREERELARKAAKGAKKNEEGP